MDSEDRDYWKGWKNPQALAGGAPGRGLKISPGEREYFRYTDVSAAVERLGRGSLRNRDFGGLSFRKARPDQR